MSELYAPYESYNSFHLPVGDGHSLYVQEAGNPQGIPVVFLHGGPGGGIDDNYRRFFNPEKFRVVLFDQRGCGKSTPFSSVEANTTWHLVEDIERIRNHLSIGQWIVFGGSWGSTLALTYAIKHAENVKHLVLRGIFLGSKAEISWFYQEGASKFYPDVWQSFLAPVPPEERGDMVQAYYKLLTVGEPKARQKAAKAWSQWEAVTSRLIPDQAYLAKFDATPAADAFARIECHYFINKCFFDKDQFILENIDKIKDISGYIVQGRFDIICTPDIAWNLHKAWPKSRLDYSPGAGHSVFENETTKLLVNEMNRITENF